MNLFFDSNITTISKLVDFFLEFLGLYHISKGQTSDTQKALFYLLLIVVKIDDKNSLEFGCDVH